MKILRGASNVVPVIRRVSIFTSLIVGIIGLGLTPAYALDERVIDIVELSWPGSIPSVADATEMAKIVDVEVNAEWKKFTTLFGDTKDRVISFKTGKVLKEPIALLSKMACVGQESSELMSVIRPEAYKRLDISDYSNRYLLVVSPRAGCIWSGRAGLGRASSKSGTLILHESASSFVVSHELGHTFGLGHTNFLRCENGANDGPWGETCKGVEYGGTIDVMGNVDTTSPLNTYHQWRMGYLDDSQIKQVWQSEVVNLAPSDFANGIRAIYIRDGKAAYWIEYRRKMDGDKYKPGLAIFRLDPPSINSLVSSNPEDLTAGDFGGVLGTAVWMLNLDDYQYKNSSSMGGSMTGLSATTYSKEVSISAVASETGAVVTIKKKADVTRPPVPILIPVNQWNSPNMMILKPGGEDVDTAITGFEGQFDGLTKELKASDLDGWLPTYLSPFVAPKVFYLRDLPEGSYSFAIRTIDIVGNKSEWSQTVKAVIDRADPIVTNDFVLTGANANELSLQWKGASDAGSGICQVNIVDEDGLIVQSSSVKNAPTLKVAGGSTLSGTAQVFDCLGNGKAGELSITASVVAADKGAKIGKWSPAGGAYGAGAIKCVGKCAVSLMVSGKNDVVMGTGAATISLGTKTIATVANSKSAKLRIGASIDVGSDKKVVRVSGSNFVLIGLSSFTTTLGTLKEFDRAPAISDPSLADEKQAKLAKQGFRAEDFSQEWTVLPMGGGTKTDDPSIDLCNGVYASEQNRIERRQVAATKVGSTFAFLSTEIVRYSSAAAATAAHKELVNVVAQCRIDKGFKTASGETVAYDFKTLPTIPAGVMGEGNRVFVHTIIDSGARARTLLGFYQFNGDILSALYVTTEAQLSEAQVNKWLKVAVTMGQRLIGKSA